jgi:hypothetical protein
MNFSSNETFSTIVYASPMPTLARQDYCIWQELNGVPAENDQIWGWPATFESIPFA